MKTELNMKNNTKLNYSVKHQHAKIPKLKINLYIYCDI